MPHRRATAPVLVLVLLVAGALSGCGFDAPTNRINNVAAGASDRSGKVDALGIRVLSASAGQGRLIGALANNTAEEAALTEVAGEVITAQDFEPVTVPSADSVNLAAEDVTSIGLTGDFVAGEVISIDLTFDTSETVTLPVPVVKYCGQYTLVPSPSVTAAQEAATIDGDRYLCERTDDDSAN